MITDWVVLSTVSYQGQVSEFCFITIYHHVSGVILALPITRGTYMVRAINGTKVYRKGILLPGQLSLLSLMSPFGDY